MNAKTHRIAVVGMGRSGSTVLWEMAHKVLELNGTGAERGVNIENALASDSHVLKVHPYWKRVHDWVDTVLAPRRDIREAADSYERIIPDRITNEEQVRHVCNELVGQYAMWEAHMDYEMVYERFRDDPKKVVAEIEEALGFEPKFADKILLDVGTPPKRKPMVLKPSWIELIDAEYGEWLRRFGYPIPGNFEFR